MSDVEGLARAVRAHGAVSLLDKICDHTTSYRDGFLGVGGMEKLKGGARIVPSTKLDALVGLKLVKRERGKVRATALGFSVSTRLIVMKAQGR